MYIASTATSAVVIAAAYITFLIPETRASNTLIILIMLMPRVSYREYYLTWGSPGHRSNSRRPAVSHSSRQHENFALMRIDCYRSIASYAKTRERQFIRAHTVFGILCNNLFNNAAIFFLIKSLSLDHSNVDK